MTRINTAFVALVLAGAALWAACSKSTPEPEPGRTTEGPTPVPAPVPSATAVTPSGHPAGGAATAAGPDELAWDVPKTWESLPNPNAMRKATYKVPKASGDTEDGELSVSAASGGVEPNVKRWASQFGNATPKTESRTPNGLKVTVVEIKGTFASGGGMMGGPATSKEKFMLLGAVVDGGERQHFFKLTGPEKTVSAARKDFDAFVASFRAK